MKKFIVETYYTCTFKTVHTLDNLNDVLTNTNNLIESNESTITNTLDNLNNLTTDLSQKLEDINPIIEGANDMITTLNKVNFENTFNQIDILLTSMNGVFDDLESEREVLYHYSFLMTHSIII